MLNADAASVAPPAEVVSYVRELAAALAEELGDDLEGVYLHGSAVLGGFHPAASDVDVLAERRHLRHRRRPGSVPVRGACQQRR